MGVERWDGNKAQSEADCQSEENTTLGADWGILLCSNNNGDGTYQGYYNRHYDISWMLFNWGNGNIMTGGTTICDWDANGETAFNPNAAP
jgi:hypothetical protein